MSLSHENILEQKQILSNKQIQSLELLVMNEIELNQFLQDEYFENPLLDYVESKGLNQEDIKNNYEYTQNSTNYSGIIINDNDRLKGIAVSDTETIESYMLSQLRVNKFTKDEMYIFVNLINNLDETGYFTVPIDEIANKINVSAKKIICKLEILKELEPYGIFSENLQECLLKQLEKKDMKNTVAWKIVEDFFEDIAQSKFSRISRSLKISTAEVRKNLAAIERLNAYPLQSFETINNEYIIPDIIIKHNKDGLVPEINSSFVENYKINDYYINMMKQSKDKELLEYFSNKLERIRFIMNCIEQRRNTVINICNQIISYQNNFFIGKGPLQAMAMKDIAEKMEIHISTLSRAIKGKYIQYPAGTMLMKDLFSNKVHISNEEDISVLSVKALIKKFIDEEDKSEPLSDQKVLIMLKELDIDLSRRVIAKYREELGIRSSFNRKL